MNTAKENAWIAGVAYGVSSEAGHMWAESKYDHASALYMDANFEEAFKIDDVSSVFHYKPIATLDWLSSSMSQEHNNECRVSCRMLCEDEITNLTLEACSPKISQDHIMNVDFAKNVPELDFKFCDNELNLGNSRSAINSQENSNGIDAQQVNEVNQLNKLTEAEVASAICLSANGSFGQEKARPRPKRLCHRPKKYAEELPMLKPMRGRPKKYLARSSTDKDLGVASQNKYHVKFCKRKAAMITGKLELESDDDYKPRASRVRTRPCASHVRTRHCNKHWTLDEVVKLVDGVAHFGIGQWTAIQKTFFKSSCRTPTDVRDKWRNLVNANCGFLKSKRKRSGSSLLPNTIIERVRELAKIIPKC